MSLTASPDSMQLVEALQDVAAYSDHTASRHPAGLQQHTLITHWADIVQSIMSSLTQHDHVAYSFSRLHAASGSPAGGGGVS